MATFQRRGKVWRAIVRKKGLAPKAKSFPTKAMAETWATRIEREYAERQAKGETEAAGWTLKDCIEWYEKNAGPFGRSKASDLARLKGYEIALERAADLGVREYVRHAERRKAGASSGWTTTGTKSRRPAGTFMDVTAFEETDLTLEELRAEAEAEGRKWAQWLPEGPPTHSWARSVDPMPNVGVDSADPQTEPQDEPTRDDPA